MSASRRTAISFNYTWCVTEKGEGEWGEGGIWMREVKIGSDKRWSEKWLWRRNISEGQMGWKRAHKGSCEEMRRRDGEDEMGRSRGHRVSLLRQVGLYITTGHENSRLHTFIPAGCRHTSKACTSAHTQPAPSLPALHPAAKQSQQL